MRLNKWILGLALVGASQLTTGLATGQERGMGPQDPRAPAPSYSSFDGFRSPQAAPAVSTQDPRTVSDGARRAPSTQVAQLPGAYPSQGRIGPANTAPAFGTGGAIPDASGRLIDHTYRGAGADPNFGYGGFPGAAADPARMLLNNAAALGGGNNYGFSFQGSTAPGFGTGGAIPDASGRLIDHTYRGLQPGLDGGYGGLGDPGLGYGGGFGALGGYADPAGAAGPTFGTGGSIPDASGRLIDHTYRGGAGGDAGYGGYGGGGYGGGTYSSGNAASSGFGLNGFSSNTLGSVGTGLLGGGRTNAYFSSQGFFKLSSPYSGAGSSNQQSGSALVPFTRRTTSPYLNLLQGNRGSAAVRYYGTVRPQVANESQFRLISDRVRQNNDLIRTDYATAALENQMRALIANERRRDGEALPPPNRGFSSPIGQDRFPTLSSLQGGTGDPNFDAAFRQRVMLLATQIQGTGLGVAYGNYNPITSFRVPSIGSGGSPPSNFGNAIHYYNTYNNAPNWKYSR